MSSEIKAWKNNQKSNRNIANSRNYITQYSFTEARVDILLRRKLKPQHYGTFLQILLARAPILVILFSMQSTVPAYISKDWEVHKI